MEISILMPNGAVEGFLIKSFDTCKDVVNQICVNLPPEERLKNQLVELKKGRDGVVLERALKDSTVLSQLKTEWTTDKENVYSLKIVRLDHEVVINFNTYFRMMAGVGETRCTFPFSESTTILQLTEKIKAHLKLSPTEQRFGLMGNYGANREMRKLSKEEKVLSLQTAYENPECTFFQFQVLPEMEDKRHLGADKEGYLEVYNKLPPMWKRRFFSLRGNALFAFKEKGEVAPVLEIDRLGEFRVVDHSSSKKKGLGQKFSFRFDLETDSATFSLAAEDQQSATAWMEAIKSCRTRNDARAATITSTTQMKRTLVPISSSAPAAAVAAEELNENEKLDKALEDLKKAAKALLEAKGSATVLATKSVVSLSQSFCSTITGYLDDETPKFKKEKLEEYTRNVKTSLKNVIPAAKAFGIQTGDASEELKVLKKEIKSLLDSCEVMLITLRMEDDFIAPAPVVNDRKELKITLTGNTQLDSIVSGLNMFGIAPELAEMMQQASEMPDLDLPETTNTNYKTSVADDPLESILAGLNNALDGLDVPNPKKKAAAQHVVDYSDDKARCALCFDSITGPVTKGLDRTWHSNCFYCTQCGTSLVGQKPDEIFEGPQKMPYCKKDYLALCPKCKSCKQPVLPKESFFTPSGQCYHIKCFKCQSCNTQIEGTSFEVEGLAYCENCYHNSQGTMCAECIKPIYGTALTVLGKKRHPHCFICAHCKKGLTKETAKSKNEKLYCPTCFAMLF